MCVRRSLNALLILAQRRILPWLASLIVPATGCDRTLLALPPLQISEEVGLAPYAAHLRQSECHHRELPARSSSACFC